MAEIISTDRIDSISFENGNDLKKDKKQILSDFLNRPVAERVKLKGQVVINRSILSTDDMARIGYEGKATFPERNETCELLVGGQVLAKGKIIRKKDGYYFKVVELFFNDGGKK